MATSPREMGLTRCPITGIWIPETGATPSRPRIERDYHTPKTPAFDETSIYHVPCAQNITCAGCGDTMDAGTTARRVRHTATGTWHHIHLTRLSCDTHLERRLAATGAAAR